MKGGIKHPREHALTAHQRLVKAAICLITKEMVYRVCTNSDLLHKQPIQLLERAL
jgi:hypothetical protein